MANGIMNKPFSESGKIITKTLSNEQLSTSNTIKIPNLARAIFIIESSSINRCACILVISYSSGAVFIQEISKGNDVTFSTGTNELTITTSTSGTCELAIMSMQNDVDSYAFL